MKKQKNIQMPFAFVTEVLRLVWILDKYDLDSDTAALTKSIESQIKAKFDAMIRREAYIKYKDSESGSKERENFRRRYLELVGINKDWVSDIEF